MEHQCKVCKLKYSNAQTAEDCQAWCSTHDSCNYLIARQAINKTEILDRSPQEFDERFKK